MSKPTIEDAIRRDVNLGLIKPSLEPIKCVCGCSDFYDSNHQYEANVLSEHETRCKECDLLVGYWSFGAWDPPY